MRITKAFLTAAALLISAIPLPAQDGYFPIGVSLVHNSSSPISWSQELLKLQALGVNEIGDWTFPNDTLWLKNVCLPSNGAIKLFTYDGPHYVGYNRYDSTLCWGFIRPAPDGTNWADSLPPDSVWQTIVKAHIDDVISNYIQRPEWAGHYGGLYIMNELKWDEPYWNEQQWNNVYTVVEWACNYWRYNANVPDGLKGRTIYIMASQLLTPELGTTLKTFAERLGSLGIFENDRYPFYPYVPAQYTTNTDSFTMFQQHLQLWVGDGDSCLKYFEKDGTSRKWYALIQAFKAQICTTGTDTTTVKGWKDTWRWPTREEIRAQAWLALSRRGQGHKILCISKFTGRFIAWSMRCRYRKILGVS